MSLVRAAASQIKRHGFKGAATLTRVTTVEDLDNLTVTPTDAPPISLLAFVGSFPSSRIDGKAIFANDRRVLAAPDADWDGTLDEKSKITIDSVEYSIENFAIKRISQVIAYVEIQVRG